MAARPPHLVWTTLADAIVVAFGGAAGIVWQTPKMLPDIRADTLESPLGILGTSMLSVTTEDRRGVRARKRKQLRPRSSLWPGCLGNLRLPRQIAPFSGAALLPCKRKCTGAFNSPSHATLPRGFAGKSWDMLGLMTPTATPLFEPDFEVGDLSLNALRLA